MIWCVTLNPALDVVFDMVGSMVIGDIHPARSMMARLGGKGNNVARVVKALGGDATVVGIYGGAVGHTLAAVADAEGLPFVGEWVEDDSRICVTLVDGDSRVTEVRPPGPVVDQLTATRLLDRMRQKLAPRDWVTISGSLPPGLSDDTYAKWIKALSPLVQGILVDTSGYALQQSLRAKPTAIVPNAEEYAAIHEKERLSNATQIIVTDGSRGLTWWSTSGDSRSWAPPSVEVRNTVGAGDAFLGGLVMQLHQGVEWDRAIPWGVAVATASVETVGVADVDSARVPLIYQKIMEVPSC